MNFQAGSTRRIKNFNEDIKDSEIYTDLIAQIAPKDAGVNKFAMKKDVSMLDMKQKKSKLTMTIPCLRT